MNEKRRAAAFFVVLAVIGALLIVASSLDKLDEAHTRPATPTCKVCHCGKTVCHRECGEENMCVVRCEGLCGKRAQRTAGSATLTREYADVNEQFFSGKLPSNTIVVLGPTSDPGSMGETVFAGGVFKITINPRWNPAPKTQLETLMHEQCHVATWDEIVVDAQGVHDEHGPRWRACIEKLKMEGAYDDLL